MKLRYCPYCGTVTKLKDWEMSCNKCGKKFHINNTPAVGVLIIKDKKVLLSKRKINPRKGYWDYPGGFLNFSEHPKIAAKREVLEETGLKIKIVDILGIYINKDYKYQGENIYPQDTVYVAKIVSGKLKAQDDVEKLKWFPIGKPPKKIAFGCVKKALKDLQKRNKKGG
jgi:ADP-ribose pyrophosphatase YjhB (NUDIX family)